MPLIQKPGGTQVWQLNIDCEEKKNDTRPGKKWDDCMVEELCKLVSDFNKIDRNKLKTVSPSPSTPGSPLNSKYTAGLLAFSERFAGAVGKTPQDTAFIKSQFSTDCRYEKWKKGEPPPPGAANPIREGEGAMNPDHVHDAKLGGPLGDIDGLKWMNARVNTTAGATMRGYPPDPKPGPQVEAMPNCGCT